MKARWRILLLLLATLLASSPAWANVGIPMLALSWPVQWLAFIPVVAGEAAIASKTLQLPYRGTLKPVAVANLWSTLIGVPIAWFGMLLLEAVGFMMLSTMPEQVAGSPAFRYASFPLFTAWIGSHISPLEFKVAFLVLMAAFCWVSILVERHVLKRYFSTADQLSLGRCVKEANIASYALLSAVTLICADSPSEMRMLW